MQRKDSYCKLIEFFHESSQRHISFKFWTMNSKSFKICVVTFSIVLCVYNSFCSNIFIIRFVVDLHDLIMIRNLKKKVNERDMRNVDLCLFRLKWEKELIETLRRDWLKKIKSTMSLLKRYSVNNHQTELTIEYYNQYLKLKVLILNENDFKNSNDWFSFKTFIELFEKIIKNLKWQRCSKWLSDKLIINSISSKRRSFSRSKDDNRSNDQSKESIIKLTDKN